MTLSLLKSQGNSNSREASLTVPDFTSFVNTRDFPISVYGSSCKQIFFRLTLAPLLPLFISWHPSLSWGCYEMKKIKQRAEIEANKVKIT